MRINDDTEQNSPEIDRGYVIFMVISSFKGYKDIQVHLFRPTWDVQEEDIYDWQRLLGSPIRLDQAVDPLGSRQVIMESFTRQEKQELLKYLIQHYESRLESITVKTLQFPVPVGLTPLCAVQEQGKLGKIRFDRLPNYNLDFLVHGLYDLSRHIDETAYPES